MIVGLDASRNRSGGAIIHIKGILENFDFESSDIIKVHLWSYKELLNKLPDYPWLIKHCPAELDSGMLKQLYWQRFGLPKELVKSSCSVLLSTDAGTVCRFQPSVVMSRDMLSYEPGMMQRFSFLSKSRLRLYLLKHMQNSSLKFASAPVFLTNYASEVIQRSTGQLNNVKIIPHGVTSVFDDKKIINKTSLLSESIIKLIYVSNISPYKNQMQVIEAVDRLIEAGYPIHLDLVGGGDSKFVRALNLFIEQNIKTPEAISQVGRLDHLGLSELLNESDIFVFASSCENMPNTLVEGMSSGLPIVCSNAGPMPEVLKDTGEYFDPNDVSSIFTAIKKVIDEDEFRLKLASKSREHVRQYSWSRCANETFTLLNQIGSKG